MTLDEKQELVRLLAIYQNELVAQNVKNIHSLATRSGDYVAVKAKYEHARILSSRLELEINNELKAMF